MNQISAFMKRVWALKSEKHSVMYFNFCGPRFSHVCNRRACVVFLELHKDLISTMVPSSTPPVSVLATVGLRREEKTMAQTVELQGTEWQMPQEE